MEGMAESLGARTQGGDLGALLPRSDRRLVKRAARGESSAFATIFERYHQDLYRYCLSILRDADDAQDALQATMASALRSLPGESREIALKPWLFRVAHNHAISIMRARMPQLEPDAVEALPDLVGESRIEARDRLRHLLGDLESLTSKQRSALILRELSGLSFEEIATTLASSPQSARQTVYEARVALQEIEEGRAMECEQVRSLISAGDGRSLRARRVRAHLRACAPCRDFRAAIEVRHADLAALAPPLPALAAAGLLHGILGGGGGAAGAAGGVAGAGIGASVALKATASIVAATALGVGVADRTGLIDLPGIGGSGEPAKQLQAPAPAKAAPADADAVTGAAAAGSSGPSSTRGAAAGERPGRGDGSPPAHSNAGGNGPAAHSNAGGNPPEHSSAGGAPQAAEPTAGAAPPAHSNAGETGPRADSSVEGAQAGTAGVAPPPKSPKPPRDSS